MAPREQQAPDQGYYENEAFWVRDFDQDSEERARLMAAAAAIPAGVASILDVGCGNGAFLQKIAGKYPRICGVDRSETALRHVHTEKRVASVDDLPFGDGEFDLVACMEVIEHLPGASFAKALEELLRVSAQWLVITVPFREDRRLSLVRCPACLCEFNRNYHLRSFDDAAMRGLFGGVSGIEVAIRHLGTVGIVERRLGLHAVRRLAAPLRRLDLPGGVVCPHCGYRRAAVSRAAADVPEGVLSRSTALQRLWPTARGPRWYLAVYEKT